MKRFLAIFLVMICSISFAQTAGTTVKFQKPDGQFVFAQTDSNGNLKITGSISTSGDAELTEWDDQVATLTANVAKTITSEISGTRKFILIKSQIANKEFWISVGGTASIYNSYPFTGTAYIEAPKTLNISVIASEGFRISVLEGGF